MWPYLSRLGNEIQDALIEAINIFQCSSFLCYTIISIKQSLPKAFLNVEGMQQKGPEWWVFLIWEGEGWSLAGYVSKHRLRSLRASFKHHPRLVKVNSKMAAEKADTEGKGASSLIPCITQTDQDFWRWDKVSLKKIMWVSKTLWWNHVWPQFWP